MSRRARENWDLMQSAKKADAAATMTDSTTYDDDGGNGGKQGEGKRGRVGAPLAEK